MGAIGFKGGELLQRVVISPRRHQELNHCPASVQHG
jgi:hypothetical protein